MVKLSDLDNNDMVCYKDFVGDLQVITKDELLHELGDGEDFGIIFTTDTVTKNIDLQDILEAFDEGDDEWLEAMQDAIYEDERKTIEDIFRRACEACPIYCPGERIEIDC